jgi:sugar phosphate isomerase/epimerase
MASRRQFINKVAGAAGLAFFSKQSFGKMNTPNSWFEISLAEWSLNKRLFDNKITNLDFPSISKKQFGISVVEYVNQFFKDKAEDTNYLNDLLQRCKDNGVKNHLIMIDGEGGLAEPDAKERNKAVENHYKWVHAAKHLGCATIRVNSFGHGSREDVKKASVEGLSKLGEYAAKENINVIVENHGGYSSDGQWMSSIMREVNMKNVGMLPDFGNFCIKSENGYTWGNNCIEEYDKYKGVAEFMPFAKGVSAKTMKFDANGNCVETDYDRMMKIVKESGFRGYIGIEYEGDIPEDEGIRKTKVILEKYL